MGSAIFVALKMAELYANVSSKNLYCNWSKMAKSILFDLVYF
jgi:hypothetical protein